MPTNEPPPFFTMICAACFSVRKVPSTLTARTRRQASSGSCVTGPSQSAPPAEAITPSSFPVTDAARATAAATCSSFVTSAAKNGASATHAAAAAPGTGAKASP